MTRRAQWLTLFILLGIWTCVALWVITRSPEIPREEAPRPARSQTARLPHGSALSVNLPLLAAARRQSEDAFVSPKNIFAPLGSDGAPTARVARPGSKRGPAAAPASPPPPSAEELAAQASRQELAQFRYLGYLSRMGREEAFLSKGTDLLIVKSQERIGSSVLVKVVTPTGVILQDTRTQVELALSLVEGAP